MFWSVEATEADYLLRAAVSQNKSPGDIQAAVNVLVRVGTHDVIMLQKLILYGFSEADAQTYVDAAYP